MASKTLKIAAAALSLLAAPVAAQAADMSVKGARAPYYKALPSSVVSYYDWSGFYVGVNGGYSFSDLEGYTVGGTVGYNLQFGSFVVGVEADGGYSDLTGNFGCAVGVVCSAQARWNATGRGRVGYAFDRFLPYFTGGIAFADTRFRNPVLAVSSNENAFGYVIGGGVEYAFMGNWTAKIEYQYQDFGAVGCGITCGGGSVDTSANIVKAGLNYRFGTGGGPAVFSRF